MTKIIILLNCILLFLSCASPCYKENNVLKAKNQYEHYLSEYYMNGDVSNIDSALKYNAEILNTDSASIVHYLNQIQLHYLCRQYDSILSFVDQIPQEMVSWIPEYKMYLRFKCKAIMARESGDTVSYRNNLDSIVVFWEPVILDSIERSDLLLSRSIDSLPSHLCFLYESYYSVVSHLHGKDSVDRILSYKKTKFNWSRDTYTIIKYNTNGGSELSLP